MHSDLSLLTTLLGIAAYTGSGQPFIITLPQSQTKVVGATATFSVIANDPLPLS
jgi:hypothetical protein